MNLKHVYLTLKGSDGSTYLKYEYLFINIITNIYFFKNYIINFFFGVRDIHEHPPSNINPSKECAANAK